MHRQLASLLLILASACDDKQAPAADAAAKSEAAGDGSADAVSTYMNKSKVSEARVHLAKMADAAAAYFSEEHVDRGAVAVLGAGGEAPTLALHRCPNDGKASGSVGPTPPLSVACDEGPKGHCSPMPEPKGDGAYAMSEWTDDPVWNALNFQLESPHYFHYAFQWANSAEGSGSCKFTAQAFADLDADGVYSTFERSGSGGKDGIEMSELRIDNELE